MLGEESGHLGTASYNVFDFNLPLRSAMSIFVAAVLVLWCDLGFYGGKHSVNLGIHSASPQTKMVLPIWNHMECFLMILT